MTAAKVNIAVAIFAAHVLEMHGDGVALFLALCVPSQDAFERGKVRHFPFSHKRKFWKQTICLFSIVNTQTTIFYVTTLNQTIKRMTRFDLVFI